MLNTCDPTQTEAWKKLELHFKEVKKTQIEELFENDADRFSNFTLKFDRILVDYSKNKITEETIKLLLDLVKEIGLEEAIKDFFDGEKINATEDRSVLHTALRNSSTRQVFVVGEDVMPKIRGVLKKCNPFPIRLFQEAGKDILANQFLILLISE